jgi:hypothetical protein
MKDIRCSQAVSNIIIQHINNLMRKKITSIFAGKKSAQNSMSFQGKTEQSKVEGNIFNFT